ncbi:MAG TPA: AAA family ATPase [Candidatus Chromulinivoraceae bacterium]|nr:AAA family ATPase [Candidatus Chromulinivoraceae bacterium]
MPLIYITGTPGSGKSAVCAELKRRGYTAFDTDKDAIAFFYNNETGEPIKGHVSAQERTPEWRSRHTWKAKREAIEKLREQAKGGLAFLCGVTANDADELWDLFTTVFALVITDRQVLQERILERDEDGYGKNPHELAALLEWQLAAVEDYRKLGAVIIDASKPLDDVVNEIESRAQLLQFESKRTAA